MTEAADAEGMEGVGGLGRIEDIVVGKKAVKEKWAVVVDMRLTILLLTE